jgi:uncharacterized protein YfaS (alpha-2-macroglobulin family)
VKKLRCFWALLLSLSLVINVYLLFGYTLSWPLFQRKSADADEFGPGGTAYLGRLMECIEALAGERPEKWQLVNDILAGRTPTPVSVVEGTSGMVPAVGGADKAAAVPARLLVLEVNALANSDSIQVKFSGEGGVLVPEEVAAAVDIAPAVPKLAIRGGYGPYWHLSGDFRPETNYVVTFRKGLVSSKGEALLADAVFNVRTSSSSPSCRFLSKGPYYPLVDASGAVSACTLPIRVRNISSLWVRLYRYHPNNLSPFGGDSWQGRWNTSKVGEVEKKLALPANEYVAMDLNVSEMFPGLELGAYQLEIAAGGESYAEDDIHLVISDLAIMVARDDLGRQARVVVRRLSDGAAVNAAQVRLFSRKNVPMAEGRTDAQGIALLDYAPDFVDPEDEAGMVLVQKDKEVSYVALDRSSEHGLAEFANSGRRFQYGPTAFVYTERGVCRPGETVTASAWLRDFQDGALRVMAEVPVLLTVLDPRGTAISTERLSSDKYGFVTCPVRIPRNARTGAYSLRFGLDGKSVWGCCQLLVSEYVPDRVRVSLAPREELVTTAAAVSFKADARYYFGAELPRALYSLSVVAERARPPAHWTGFTVGDAENFRAGKMFSEEGLPLPADGVLRYPGFEAMGGNCNEPVTLVATLSVTEPGGRAVSARALQRCEPGASYLGLRYDGVAPDSGQIRIGFRVLTWDKNSEPVAKERSYALRLWRRDWHYVQKLSDNSIRYEWELKRTELPRPETVNLARLQGEIMLPVLDSGLYELEASSANGIQTRLVFWHDAGEGGARSANPQVLSFSTDKSLYLPGDRAVVTVDSPAAGELFVVAGEHALRHSAAQPAQAGANTLVIPIPVSCLGSEYFAGITLVYRGQAGPLRSFGLLKLSLDQSRRRLQVTLEAPDQVLPGETINITAKLRGQDGAPSAGLVQLFAVDEGILALTGYDTPDIFAFFHGHYYCGFQFYDLYSRLFPLVKIGNAGKIGGDGVARELAKRLGDVKVAAPALVVLPALAVPESGVVQAKMDLPRHLGAMRLMAVAASTDTCGSSERLITLRDVISVLPSAPRALAAGDECELSFSVINQDCPDGDYSLEITLPAALTALTPVTFSGQLARGASQVQTLRCRASEQIGSHEIVSTLRLGAAQSEARTPVTIRAANPPVSKVTLYTLRPGESMQVSPAPEEWQEVQAMRVRVSASAAIALPQAMNWLNQYPYGCLEQSTAMAFPFLAVDNLVKSGAINAAVGQTAGEKVSSTAGYILSMLLGDGSFAGWPGATSGCPETTVFAQHFLLAAAQRELYELDPYVRIQILRYLRALANKGDAARVVRGHASYVLALAGDDGFVSGARNVLANDVCDYGTLWAAAALIRGGYAAEGMPHLERALAAEVWRESDANASFSSAASRHGCALTLLMELAPKHPAVAKIALAMPGLIRQDDSGWGTTQANAWVCMGLAAYAVEYGFGRAVGTLSLTGGKDVPINSDRCFDMELPVSESGTLVNTGAQPFLVQLSVDGVPRKLESTSGAMKIRRTYVDADGKEVTRVKHGQLLTVTLSVESSGKIDNLVLVDLLPGGLEIEDPRLATRSAALPPLGHDHQELLLPEFLERRDDRFLFFGSLIGNGTGYARYVVRAVTRGKFVIPPLRAEAMYDPDVAATFVPEGVFEVE